MALETLSRSLENTNNQPETKLDADTKALLLGMTAFEALAVDASQIRGPEDTDSMIPFTNSVTRLGDGQTVPDER